MAGSAENRNRGGGGEVITVDPCDTADLPVDESDESGMRIETPTPCTTVAPPVLAVRTQGRSGIKALLSRR